MLETFKGDQDAGYDLLSPPTFNVGFMDTLRFGV